MIVAKQELGVGRLPAIVDPEPITGILTNLPFQTEIDPSGDLGGGNSPARDEVVDLDDRLGVWREVASAQARSGDRQSADATIRDMRQAILEDPPAAGRFGSLGEGVAAEAG